MAITKSINSDFDYEFSACYLLIDDVRISLLFKQVDINIRGYATAEARENAKSNNKINGEFDIQKSKVTNKGLFGFINIYGSPNIYTIYHELNHALKFYYKGKTSSLKNLSSLKSVKVLSKKTSI